MLDTPITEDDLDFIDAMLEKYGGDDAILSVSELDGFLTSIVSGPDMIMPSEWLPAIWGDDGDTPKWESDEEAMRFIRIVMGIMNDNAQTLVQQPEDFEAMFLMDIENGQPVEIVALWCYGYIRAVLMRSQSWEQLPEEIGQQLEYIALFGSHLGEEKLVQLPYETIGEMAKKVEPAARVIHAYWLSKRAHLAPSRRATGPASGAKVLPFVRPQAKIGPNQHCPCGSGKKYKKCCGAQ